MNSSSGTFNRVVTEIKDSLDKGDAEGRARALGDLMLLASRPAAPKEAIKLQDALISAQGFTRSSSEAARSALKVCGYLPKPN